LFQATDVCLFQRALGHPSWTEFCGPPQAFLHRAATRHVMMRSNETGLV
jgi:hypothetical protein